MLLKVIDRMNFISMLPADDGTGLTTGLVIKRLKEKLLLNAGEVEELHMVTGVICTECNSPVENRGTPEDPKYYCIVCGDFITETSGMENKTLWSAEADTGKQIDLNKIERSVYISIFNKLDEAEDTKPAQVDVWVKLNEFYPKSFPIPEDLDEED